jgi:flagellar basal-body rod modification protein FlgD
VTISSTNDSAAAAARLAQIQAASGGTRSGATPGADATASAAGTEDRFLKLLVAQMRNQDPLNPMDNAQVTSQLAQINTVRGIETLNASVAKLVERGDRASPLDSVGALGRQALVAGERFERSGDETSHRLGIELTTPARRAQLDVLDAAGAVVFSRSFEAPSAGVVGVDWNGNGVNGEPARAGQYRVRVSAIGEDGKSLPATALSAARVSGVAQDGSGVRLELLGRGAVAPSAVRAIL